MLLLWIALAIVALIVVSFLALADIGGDGPRRSLGDAEERLREIDPEREVEAGMRARSSYADAALDRWARRP